MTAGAEGHVLHADAVLEQQRHGRVPYLLAVVGDHEGDGAVRAADAVQDRGQHVGQLGADDQQPFLVGLGRGDVQQRDQLAGGGQPVLDQAVMGELGELFDPDAGVAEDFHGRPRPERVVFLAGEVAPGAGRRPRPRSAGSGWSGRGGAWSARPR